jgi:hypothetical protein
MYMHRVCQTYTYISQVFKNCINTNNNNNNNNKISTKLYKTISLVINIDISLFDKKRLVNPYNIG